MSLACARVERVVAPAPPGGGRAAGPVAAREGVRVVLDDGAGHVGVGEALPLPGYSLACDTPERALALLRGHADQAFPLDARDGEAPCAQLAAASQPLAASPSARFALEGALLDLWSRRRGVPAWRLLAGAPSSALPAVRVAALLPATTLEPAAVLEAARAALARGATTLKLKVGRPAQLDAELALLRALRVALGGHVALRLDANGALDLANARALLAAAAAHEVRAELVEEPCHRAALATLAAHPSPLPWALDETLAYEPLDPALAAAPACVAWVLKPALLGGLARCVTLAERAFASGRSVLVTHLLDGAAGLAAATHLALALATRGPVLACGLDPFGAALEPRERARWPLVRAGALVDGDGRAGLGIAGGGLPA